MKASLDTLKQMIQQNGVFKLPIMRRRYSKYVKDYRRYKLDVCHFCGDSYFKRLDNSKDTLGYCNRQCQMSCPDQRKKQGKALSKTQREHPEIHKKGLEKAIRNNQEEMHKIATDKIAKWEKEGKQCSKCGEIKPLSEFYKDKRKVSILPVLPWCKECGYQEHKKWVNENREHRNAYSAKRDKDRKLIDPKYKLRCTMGQRISGSLNRRLKGVKQERRKHWERLLGYTVDDLMRRLEKLFKPGMTWENYGEWHLDHIIPLAAFNYTSVGDIDFKRAWALTNLQPLWAVENSKKGAKLEKPFQPSFAFAVNQ